MKLNILNDWWDPRNGWQKKHEDPVRDMQRFEAAQRKAKYEWSRHRDFSEPAALFWSLDQARRRELMLHLFQEFREVEANPIGQVATACHATLKLTMRTLDDIISERYAAFLLEEALYDQRVERSLKEPKGSMAELADGWVPDGLP